MDGMSFVYIGHQKGRNTKENIFRNFGMPMPNGYVYTRHLLTFFMIYLEHCSTVQQSQSFLHQLSGCERFFSIIVENQRIQ